MRDNLIKKRMIQVWVNQAIIDQKKLTKAYLAYEMARFILYLAAFEFFIIGLIGLNFNLLSLAVALLALTWTIKTFDPIDVQLNRNLSLISLSLQIIEEEDPLHQQIDNIFIDYQNIRLNCRGEIILMKALALYFFIFCFCFA